MFPPVLITSTGDVAADLIVIELRRRNVEAIRLNLDLFPANISAAWGSGDVVFDLGDRLVNLAEAESIWFRRWPSRRLDGVAHDWLGVVEEECRTFLEGAIELTASNWMNRPALVQRAENKVIQLGVAQRIGLRVPRTLVTNSAGAARAFVGELERALFKQVKVAFRQSADGGEFFYATPVSVSELADEQVSTSPTIFQELIRATREWRCTVVGARVFAAEINWRPTESVVDVHLAPPSEYVVRAAQAPQTLVRNCLDIASSFGLTYCAIDAIEDANGSIYFLELNPAGQWGWIEQLTGMNITSAIADQLLAWTAAPVRTGEGSAGEI